MFVLCYHNGALGHTVSALIECCTKEGGREMPSFVKNKNLHHFVSQHKLHIVDHPQCNMQTRRDESYTVIASSSHSLQGRLLILLMGLSKWSKTIPDYNKPFMYNQGSGSYGEQLEILGLTLKDKIISEQCWFLDADIVLDIMSFWTNTKDVVYFLLQMGLTPDEQKVEAFCAEVRSTNQDYFDTVEKTCKVAEQVINNESVKIELSFFQEAMTYALLMNKYNIPLKQTKILMDKPTSTEHFRYIFKDKSWPNHLT